MLLRIITVCALLFSGLVIVSVGMQTPIGMVFKSMIGHVPYGDKTLHFLLTAGLSFLLNASLNGRLFTIGKTNLLLGSLIVCIVITLEEFSQAFIPSRNFEFLDMLCNYAGVFTGSFLTLFFPSLSTANNHDHHRKTISI